MLLWLLVAHPINVSWKLISLMIEVIEMIMMYYYFIYLSNVRLQPTLKSSLYSPYGIASGGRDEIEVMMDTMHATFVIIQTIFVFGNKSEAFIGGKQTFLNFLSSYFELRESYQVIKNTIIIYILCFKENCLCCCCS